MRMNVYSGRLLLKVASAPIGSLFAQPRITKVQYQIVIFDAVLNFC